MDVDVACGQEGAARRRRRLGSANARRARTTLCRPSRPRAPFSHEMIESSSVERISRTLTRNSGGEPARCGCWLIAVDSGATSINRARNEWNIADLCLELEVVMRFRTRRSSMRDNFKNRIEQNNMTNRLLAMSGDEVG